MTYRLVALAAVALATPGCRQAATPKTANAAASDITALDEGNLSADTNITELPADDGDAPAEAETNTK